MGKSLPRDELELYRRCDEVLHYVWDPIGISASAEARDEYTSYLPGVFRLLISGVGEDELAEHLSTIARDRMGLGGSDGRARSAAALLVDWRGKLTGGGS